MQENSLVKLAPDQNTIEVPQNTLFQITISPESLPEVKSFYQQQESGLTISTAISQPRQISSLRRDFPLELKLVIVALIENLLSALNLSGRGEKMSPIQVGECAKLIVDEFWILRPEEIMYVFRQAASGKYGSTFNKIDSLTICGWIRTYIDTERLDHVTLANKIKQKESVKALEENVDIYARLRAEAADPNFVSESKKKRMDENSELKKNADFEQYKADYFAKKQSAPPKEELF